MKKIISTLLCCFSAFSVNANPMIDASIYQQAQQTKELNCENCAEIASAILSMHERLCGVALEKSSYVEVKESHIYEYALKEVSELTGDKKETFILAVQKGANCVDEQNWEERTDFYYRQLSRAKHKPKRSLLFWKDDENEG
ncbi:hypothetical protein P7F88_01435 [Vibrio hannami]|uniref:hypothetical protein n=1 Tax=Vibrio hannami TaxID=2717094 RepID=UPI00240F5B1B|nr:hypothetical protein [Vibrio hannami]MDG3084818.1 hypothetical protein [Vibrio hannami]